MAEIKKQFADTVEGEDGKLYTEPLGPEGHREGVKVTQFEESYEDENGNIIVKGRTDELPKEGKAHAKVVKQFDDTIDHGEYLETVPKPDFAE